MTTPTTAGTAPRGRHRSSSRRRRQDATLLAVATALGLWWGMAAPGTSPAAPPPAPVASAPLVQPAAPAAQPAPAAPPGGHR